MRTLLTFSSELKLVPVRPLDATLPASYVASWLNTHATASRADADDSTDFPFFTACTFTSLASSWEDGITRCGMEHRDVSLRIGRGAWVGARM